MKDEQLDFPESFIKEIQTSDYRKNTESKVWDLTLLFLEGRQWVTWDNTSRGYVNTSKTNTQWKITVNLLLNIYRNLLSKLQTTYPSVAVTPASASTEDIVKAQVSELTLKYYWMKDSVKETISEAFAWLLSCGTIGLHSYLDPDDGEVKTEVINPYDLVFEPFVDKPSESDFIAIRRHVKRWQLKKTFPEHKKFIDEANDSLDPAKRPGEATYASVPANRVEVFEVYWQDGKHAILLGDTYLYQGENPLGYIPIEIVKYTEVPGKLWGIGVLSPLVDIQWLYNKSRAQVLQNIELMSNPKWLIPKTCGVNPQAISGRAGEKVFYTPAGGKPEQISAAPLPGHVFDNISRLQSEMMDISGIHSTSLGKRAVGISSGKAIEALSGQDMGQLGVSQLAMELAVGKVAQTVLRLMKIYYKEDRMIRMMDGVGKLVFKQLKNTDLDDNPEIFIETGSLYRSEAVDRDAKILELYEMKLLPPEEALKELSYKTGNRFVVQRMESMAHAQELLDASKLGYDIEIFRTDDLAVFKEVFGGFMKQSDYYSLKEETQDYIRDVYVAIESAGLPPQEGQEQQAMDKVFPRDVSPEKIKDQIGAVLTQESKQAQAQQIEGNLGMAKLAGSFEGAERQLARGSEALMSNKGRL